MGRLLISLVLGGAVFAFIGYQFGLFSPTDTSDVGTTGEKGSSGANLPNLGGDLDAWERPKSAQHLESATALRNPIIFTAHPTVLEKLEVAPNVPGRILFVGEEVPEGLVQVAGVAAFVSPPFENISIPGPKEEITFVYRRLYENDVVRNKQMVAKMDPTKIGSELALKSGKVRVAEAQARAAIAAHGEAYNRKLRADDLFRRKVIPEEEWGTAVLTEVKFREESNTKQRELEQAGVEHEQTLILYNQHDIINDLGVLRARVLKVTKSRGEVVKEQEPILLLQNQERLLAEAQLELQFFERAERIMVGKRVTVEPLIEQAPLLTFKGHRGEINAVAIARDIKRPRYVSASEDGTVCVWDQFSKGPALEFEHNDPVRALALMPPTPAGSKFEAPNLALTGTSDGSVFLWDLDRPDPKPAPLKEFSKVHRDAVTAVAFSHDGKYFATASAAAQIILWRTEDFAQLYPFDAEHVIGDPHRGSITALAFTPQGLLISASRDNTVRMWELKEKGAKLKGRPITGRSGGISQLGVSADGGWMFLDRGKDLQILSAFDGSRIATIDNTSGNPFESVAVFAPDSSLLLTAGAPEGRLQLWRAPEEHRRAREVRQLVTLDRSAVTCAAFSPHAAMGGLHATAVSGGKDGYVYLWELPSRKEVEEHGTPATVTLVGSSVEPGSRQIRVGVEVPNLPTREFPEGRFTPGRPVTIVVD